jgi:integrase
VGHKYFYLTKRADKKGVYYARFVLDKPFGGSEVLPWVSTGCKDERAAADWAASHGPAPKKRIPLGETMPFSVYADGWWKLDHDYVRRQVARGFNLGGAYLKQCRSLLSNHILPAFGKAYLIQITPRQVDDWLFALAGKGLSSGTINHCLSVLTLMMREAKFKELIKENPTDGVRRMANRPNARGILTIQEAKALLVEATIDEVWDGNLIHYTINLLAASTGMRAGEIMALRAGHVHVEETPPWVDIASAWKKNSDDTSSGTYGDPKCRSFRQIPLPPKTSRFLAIVMNGKGPDDLLFPGDANRFASRTGKDADTCISPIGHKAIQAHLYSALAKINVDPLERHIVFHSWRHWYATIVRNSAVLPDHVTRRLTGHKSNALEGYTHTSRDDLTPVLKIVGEALNE